MRGCQGGEQDLLMTRGSRRFLHRQSRTEPPPQRPFGPIKFLIPLDEGLSGERAGSLPLTLAKPGFAGIRE
jgi:hypothetical protein